MAVAASQAVVENLFCIEENREEEADKTPPTCSTNQGNQHFSHLVYCDTRINKFLGHLHIVRMPLIRESNFFLIKETSYQN